MNVEKIKKRCMKYGTCVLITNEDQQWIGTDEAMYPVEGVRLSAASIAGLFGLNREEQDNLQIREEENYMTQDALYATIRETDEPCEIEAWTINANGGEIGQAVGKITGRRAWFWMDAIKAAKKEGGHAQVAISYTTGEVFTHEYYVNYAKPYSQTDLQPRTFVCVPRGTLPTGLHNVFTRLCKLKKAK